MTTSPPNTPEEAPLAQDVDESPPVLGSWRALYLLLVAELVLITALSYALSWWAA